MRIYIHTVYGEFWSSMVQWYTCIMWDYVEWRWPEYGAPGLSFEKKIIKNNKEKSKLKLFNQQTAAFFLFIFFSDDKPGAPYLREGGGTGDDISSFWSFMSIVESQKLETGGDISSFWWVYVDCRGLERSWRLRGWYSFILMSLFRM